MTVVVPALLGASAGGAVEPNCDAVLYGVNRIGAAAAPGGWAGGGDDGRVWFGMNAGLGAGPEAIGGGGGVVCSGGIAATGAGGGGGGGG
jgi:hypothetical protein